MEWSELYVSVLSNTVGMRQTALQWQKYLKKIVQGVKIAPSLLLLTIWWHSSSSSRPGSELCAQSHSGTKAAAPTEQRLLWWRKHSLYPHSSTLRKTSMCRLYLYCSSSFLCWILSFTSGFWKKKKKERKDLMQLNPKIQALWKPWTGYD